MNHILFSDSELSSDGLLTLKGRRFLHLREILGKNTNDTVKGGFINGKKGYARIIELTESRAVLEPFFDEDPPAKIPLTLVIAMQRPKTLRKVLHFAAGAGIKKIYIIRTWRVEKSYFSNNIITDKGLREALIPGLEQALDTVLPEVFIRKKFKPFVEDELPAIIGNSKALAAHPYADTPCPHAVGSAVTLAVGPEGGFIPYEIDLLKSHGFSTISLGERILRTEEALPFLTGRLF